MSGPRASEAERRRLAEAAAWRVHLSEIDADTSDEFEAWLAEPLNRAAWDQVQASWQAFDAGAAAPELIDARQAALADARRVAARRWRARSVAQNLALTAATIALFIAAALVGITMWNAPARYQTALGERRVITLEDGSRISLDSGSEVEVAYGERSRELRLARGQARFDVAHDVERPFSVTARGQKVVAIGTAFNVDVTGAGVLVTLIEGRVVVLDEAAKPASASSKPKPLELAAGQQLTVAAARAPVIASVSLEKATAWERGQLMFDNEPLASIVARVSRYSQTKVTVADPKAGAMRISGVFNTGDVAGFVDTVTRYLPVEATNDGKNIRLHAKGER